MMPVLRTMPAKFALFIVFALATTSAHGQTHEVPYKTLMDTARAHAVVAAFGAASFDAAAASYPRNEAGGVTTVRTGNYLRWKITHLFQSDRRVERIALTRFRETFTLKRSQYGNTVACRLTATIAITHGGQTRRFNFAVRRNVGRFVTPKPGEDWSVTYSGLAATLDDVVKGLAVQLRRMGAL